MIVTDCYWEKDNLGDSTVEILLDRNDSIYDNMFNDIINKYEYVVVKVPMNIIEFNKLLGQKGFFLVEVQINVSSRVKDFKWERVDLNLDDIDFEVLSSLDSLIDIQNQITVDMFSTDRISLDRLYGPQIGMKRYVNWINSEYQAKKSQIAIVNYKHENVGFMMFRIEGGVFRLLLNGLYKKWQGRHLGIITPASPLLYLRNKTDEVEIVKTSISSNNIPVVKLYNRLGYIWENQTYVFVKHNR